MRQLNPPKDQLGRRCPTCAAPAGQPCRTVTGRPMALAHRDRSHR